MKNNRHFTDALFEEFDYFNDEIDNILTEDLDTMLKYCNNLQNWNKQELLKFLTKDPTWNENKEQGQYSKWILDKLNRNLLNNSHLGHLHDVLKRFEDNKKYLKNKDINKFKSVQEIDIYLNDDNNYNELSHSQIVRQHRRDKQNVDLGNEAELIYEDSDWEIWIPKTYAASCKLGQGSSWCTASTESSHYFDSYSKKGPLYIILNKHNEKEKYQFHFESESYMDIDDKKINLLHFIEKESNKKCVTALRQSNKHFDKQCDDIFNKAKETHEELDNFLQKIKSIETIWYPSEKWIIEEINKFTHDSDYYKYLTSEDLNKIKNIKFDLRISYDVEEIKYREFAYVGDHIKQVYFADDGHLKFIDKYAFCGCSNLIELDLPNSTHKIEDGAFAHCKNLESIILPSNLSSIASDLFIGCEKLKNVIIPENIEYIGHFAFEGCTSLTSIEIPSNVTRIGMRAFSRCSSLIKIELPNSIIDICAHAFADCPNLIIKTSNPYVIKYCIKNNIKYEKK